MKQYIALGSILAAIWLLNSGHYTPLLLVLLLCSMVFVLWLSHRMGLMDSELLPIRIIVRGIPYCLWLGKQLVLSNIDVVKRIWVGPDSLDPVFETMPISQHTDVGRVILANSITLTPGTVTVALEHDCVKVHALNREGWEALRDGDIDQRVSRLEQ